MSTENHTNADTSTGAADEAFLKQGEGDAAFEEHGKEGGATRDEERVIAARELAEHNALAQVFDDVRQQSAASVLVQPARWEAVGLVPEHLGPEEFEMLVYEYLEDTREARVEAEVVVETPVYRTATRAVGVPLFGKKEVVEAAGLEDSDIAAVCGDDSAEALSRGENADSKTSVCDDVAARESLTEAAFDVEGAPEDAFRNAEESSAVLDSDDLFANLNIPEGFKLVELEGEYVLVPDDNASPVERTIDCASVVTLVGAHSYYLYDRSVMTDAYAHWAFLAAEDNEVVTFVDCVREDSRVYPRPLAASSLTNEPFNMSPDDVARTWDIVRESGEYPDIRQTIASNGEVYYFSTDYLSEVYGASLAEWDAVERKMNM